MAVTVNGDRYGAMLNEFLFTKIEEEDIGTLDIWFQQDSTTCHIAETTLDVLCPVFKDHIISRRADAFGHLGAAIRHRWKDKCYADKP